MSIIDTISFMSSAEAREHLKVNGFDEDLINNEDFDLIIRLIKQRYKYLIYKYLYE